MWSTAATGFTSAQATPAVWSWCSTMALCRVSARVVKSFAIFLLMPTGFATNSKAVRTWPGALCLHGVALLATSPATGPHKLTGAARGQRLPSLQNN